MALLYGASVAIESDAAQDADTPFDIPNDVTHVIARIDNTPKVRAATLTMGVYLGNWRDYLLISSTDVVDSVS